MKRNFSITYKILTTLILLTGITLNVAKTPSIISLLSFYTFQSNILCFFAFVIFTVIEIMEKNGKCAKGDIYYFCKGAITIIIFITMVCYNLSLAPQFGLKMGLKEATNTYNFIANCIVHIIGPILVILDYFLFDEKGWFKMYYLFLWLCFPYSYLAYVYIYALQGGSFLDTGGSIRFGYFFLDYVEIGVAGVVKWLIIITIGILLASYLLVLIDNTCKKNKR